jgi:hypothetical protein
VLFAFLAVTFPIFSQIIGISAAAQADQAETEAQRVAGGLQSVDRLVRSSASTGTIGQHLDLAPRIGNNRYRILVRSDHDGPQFIIIQTQSLDVEVSVQFNTTTKVANTTVEGGEIFIVRRDGASEITVEAEGTS